MKRSWTLLTTSELAVLPIGTAGLAEEAAIAADWRSLPEARIHMATQTTAAQIPVAAILDGRRGNFHYWQVFFAGLPSKRSRVHWISSGTSGESGATTET